MQNCPRCGFEIKSDFGMVNCPSCGELVLLDDSVEPPSQQKTQTKKGTTAPGAEDFNFSVDDIEVVPPPPPSSSPEPVEAEAEFEFEEIASVVAPRTAGDELKEIAAYGNSEVSQANDGLLMFDVIVEGIDTNELRGAVRDILNDKRFLWNGDSLINGIKNGHLRISKLNSIKASILVKRLKHLDLKIRWEQYAIIQMARS